MKKLLLALLLSTALHSQTISVRSCKLLYDSDAQIMTLVIPKSLMKVTSVKDQVEVALFKSFVLSVNKKSANSCFSHKGYDLGKIKGFTYTSDYMVIYGDDGTNHLYVFPTIEPGEYVLQVSNIENKNKITNKQSKLLIAE